MNEGSNESSVVNPSRELNTNDSHEPQKCVEEGTLKGTFVQTVTKNDKTPVIMLRESENENENNSSFISTSIQAKQL